MNEYSKEDILKYIDTQIKNTKKTILKIFDKHFGDAEICKRRFIRFDAMVKLFCKDGINQMYKGQDCGFGWDGFTILNFVRDYFNDLSMNKDLVEWKYTYHNYDKQIILDKEIPEEKKTIIYDRYINAMKNNKEIEAGGFKYHYSINEEKLEK